MLPAFLASTYHHAIIISHNALGRAVTFIVNQVNEQQGGTFKWEQNLMIGGHLRAS